MSDKIYLSSNPVDLTEEQDFKFATFLINVLDEYDAAGRLIPKKTAEACGQTLIGAPILAKLLYNPVTGKPEDFSDHRFFVYIDSNGKKQCAFGTVAIGSITEQWIEKREVPGYDEAKECLMIRAKLWASRYPEYMTVLNKLWARGRVASSWELTVHKKEKTNKGVILKDITFIGNACLGSAVTPAVSSAGIIECASLEDDSDAIDLALALSKDVASLNIDNSQEENIVSKNDTVEPVVSQTDGATTDMDCASLTERDTKEKINRAICEKTKRYFWVSYWFPNEKKVWCQDGRASSELDYMEFTYDVDDSDVVTVSDGVEVKLTVSIADINSTIAEKEAAIAEKEAVIAEKEAAIAEKDALLVAANEKIGELNDTVSGLLPFKEEHEAIEREKAEAALAAQREELKNKLVASKLFSNDEIASEEISQLIAAVNTAGINALIVDRMVAAQTKETKEIATASKSEFVPAARIDGNSGEGISLIDLISAYHR